MASNLGARSLMTPARGEPGQPGPGKSRLVIEIDSEDSEQLPSYELPSSSHLATMISTSNSIPADGLQDGLPTYTKSAAEAIRRSLVPQELRTRQLTPEEKEQQKIERAMRNLSLLLPRLRSESVFKEIEGNNRFDPSARLEMVEESSRLEYAEDEECDALQAQSDEVSDPASGTCQWIYARPQYKEWLQKKSPVLLILADPGLGKSVLAKSITRQFQNDGEPVMTFFCKKGQSQRESTTSIIASFLYRLLVENVTLARHINRSLAEKTDNLTFNELWKLLISITQDSQLKDQIFVIDAIDECSDNSQQVFGSSLLKDLSSVRFRLLITARGGRHTILLGKHLPYLEMDSEAISTDITTFVNHKITSHHFEIYDKEMVEILKESMDTGAQGMFLRIALRLDEFENERNKKTFSTTRESLTRFFSQSSGKLMDYYGMMIEDTMNDLGPKSMQMAADLLSLMLASQTTVTGPLLRAFYAFSHESFASFDHYIAKSESDMIDTAKRLCGPIVRLRLNDQKSKTLSIIHQTARDFLENSLPESSIDTSGDESSVFGHLGILNSIRTTMGHALIARACLAFLFLPDLGILGEDFTFSKYPLLRYLISYLPLHIRESQENYKSYIGLLRRFLVQDSSVYQTWSALRTWDQRTLQLIPIAILLVCERMDHILRLISIESDMSHTLLGNPIDIDATDEYGSTALLYAIARGYDKAALTLLDLGASRQKANNDGLTPMQTAIVKESTEELIRSLANGNVDIDAETGPVSLEGKIVGHVSMIFASLFSLRMFNLLLDLGATKFVRTFDKLSILHQALLIGNLPIVQIILERKLVSDVNSADINGTVPLHIAARGQVQSLALVTYLVNEHKANVNSITGSGMNALLFASFKGKLDVVVLLLPLTEDIECTSSEWSPLIAASNNGHLGVVQALIEAGADLNRAGEDGVTSLYLASMWGHCDIAKELIEKGARVNDRNQFGRTPLYRACLSGHLEIVRLLLDRGADTSIRSSTSTCLHEAVRSANLDIVNLLVSSRHPPDVDETEEYAQMTPLLAALSIKCCEVAKALIAAGGDPNLSDSFGRNALHYVARGTHDQEMFQKVIELTRDELISDPDVNGRTPLHLAAETGFMGAVEMLIKRNADLLAQDEFGFTPLFMAAEKGHSEIVSILMDTDAEYLPDLQDGYGWTLLHVASERCDAPTVERFLSMSNWTCRRRSASTPVAIAAAYGNIPVLKVLIDAGLPVDMSSNRGDTPLLEATTIGNTEVVLWLLEHGSDIARRDFRNSSALFKAYTHEAHEDIDKLLLEKLRPTNKSSLGRDIYSLSSCIPAACSSLVMVQRLAELGCSLSEIGANNDTPLANAAGWDRPEIVKYLLKQPEVLDQINSKSLIGGFTPLIFAARSCNAECIKLLLDAGADPTIEDIFGLDALTYTKRHFRSFYALISNSPVRLTVGRTRETSQEKQQVVHQLLALISFLRQQRALPPDESQYLFRFETLSLMFEALLKLDDVENAIISIEIRIGPCSWIPGYDGSNCSHCLAHMKPPWQVCRSCPYKFICTDCREETAFNNIKGCYKHQFLEVPSQSWFVRSSDDLIENGQSEIEWLNSLAETYEAQKDPLFDDSDLPRIKTDYEDNRSSVFELCSLDDDRNLCRHLAQYPRDIWIRNDNGESLAMVTIKVATSDENSLHRLRNLSLAGARLLYRDSKGTSPVELACERYFGQSLNFLLEQYDPKFDEYDDAYAPKAIQTMISQRWQSALQAAVERHFDWTASYEFSWLQELPVLGLTDDQIFSLLVRLGVDEKSEPKDPTKRFWTELKQPTCSRKPLVGKHRANCGHSLEEKILSTFDRDLDEEEDMDSIDEIQSISSDSTSTSRTIVAMCGLGGVFPEGPGTASFTSSTTNESIVSLSYPAPHDGSYATTFECLKSAGAGLMEALRSAQDAEFCCDSFTFIQSRGRASVRHHTLDLVCVSFQFLIHFVDAVRSLADQWLSNNDVDISWQEIAVAIEDMPYLSTFYDLDGEIWSHGSIEEKVHVCCLVMQILSLGFAMFLGGHLQDYQLPIMSMHVSIFILRGSHCGQTAILKPLQMACIGDMLNDQLFAFLPGHLDTSSQEGLERQNQKYLLLTCLQDIVQTWGSARCVPEIVSKEDRAVTFLAIEIFDGHIALDGGTRDSIPTAHWSPSPYLFPPVARPFLSKDPILIGTLLVKNLKCQLGMEESWVRADNSGLVRLDTRASYWTLATRQLNLGFNAIYASGGGQFAQSKNKKLPLKNSVMNQWESRHLPVLNQPWGMMFSICTGFAKRVRLREAIGEVLISYIKDVDFEGPDGMRVPEDWKSTILVLEKKLKGDTENDDEFNNDALIKFLKHELQGQVKVYVRTAITYVLQYLRQTGVHESRLAFTVSWPNDSDPLQAYEFSCSGSASWTKIFEDSRRAATFAVATSACLVSHHRRSPFATRTSCRCLAGNKVDPIPMKLLQTKLLPHDLKGSELDEWSLQRSKHYSFFMEKSSNQLCKLEVIGRRTNRRKFLLVLSSWMDMPQKAKEELLRLVQKEVIVRENHQAYMTAVTTRGGPQPILICSMSQWREENNMS